ncbi:MAG TPA: bifunctional diguanylate cyclase/phosphodiesterase [Ancylobacter sp.]
MSWVQTIIGSIRRVRASYLLIIVAFIALQIVTFNSDIVERVYLFTVEYRDYHLDDAIVALFVLIFALAIFLAIRSRELSHEAHMRREAEALARSLERHDALTDLPNRRLLLDEIAGRLTPPPEATSTLAVFVLDIDHFKDVNDRQGLVGGDQILKIISARMRAALGADGVLGRLGGDEFGAVALIEGDDRPLLRIVRRVRAALEAPVTFDGTNWLLTASIGIARYPEDGTDADVLLHRAELATRQAQASGDRAYAIFDPMLNAEARQRRELEGDLRAAIGDGQIVAYYQPVIELASSRLVGVEALARWQHPTRGVLSPGIFIPIAEDAGLIGELFQAVFEQACTEVRVWEGVTLSINVSPQQFKNPVMAETILSTLQERRFAPRLLQIEITESALMFDTAMTKVSIAALKEAGIRLAMDDFGTGYSSLRQLHDLPFDTIKIDQSFIANVETDDESRKIVASVIALTKALGLVTVAEGVETEGQAAWLRQHGGDLAQGYLFSRPVPADEIKRLIQTERLHLA